MSNEYYKNQSFQGETFGDDLIFINCTFTPVNTFGDNVRFVDCTFETGESYYDVNIVTGYAIVSGGTLNSTIFLGDTTVSNSTTIGAIVIFANRLQNEVEYGEDVEAKAKEGNNAYVIDYDGKHVFCNPCTNYIHDNVWRDNK